MFSGDTIGKYRLVSRLGKGGMGEVWLATAAGHGGFTKTVVVKTLLPQYACDPMFIEMLAHEARICAQLSHPNLIEVFDFTEHGGIYLLAMEHVMGRPLHHIMRAARARNWPVPTWFALRVAWECCRGLQYAHEQGVIHCDLSPSNVMVTFTGITKILDFGVAHSLARGPKADRLKGKFSYIAPERIKSLATDCRTDIYSLGVMLYLVFTGQLPFTASSDEELLYKVVTTRPRRPSELAPIDSRIERLILRAMQPDPAKRFQNLAEVLGELAPCLEGQLGAYGQLDVANFVSRLFDSPEPEPAPAPLDLPAIPALPASDASDVVTNQPVARVSPARGDDDEVDIEVHSSLLEIPVEDPAAARPAPNAFRLARGSEWNAPLDNPNETSSKRPLESVSKLFAHAPAVPEPRTSVQSLFGDRTSALAFGPSKIFEGPSKIFEGPSKIFEPEPEPAPEPEPEASPPAEDTRAPRRGGFGSYSIVRPQGQTVWPWASSRTKSD